MSCAAAPPRRAAGPLRRVLVLAGALLAGPALAVLGAGTAAGAWSHPQRLAGCAAAAPRTVPLVVFPSSQPTARSGPGALLWGGPRGSCARGALLAAGLQARGGASGDGVAPGPGAPASARGGGLADAYAAIGTAAGQVLAAGRAPAAGGAAGAAGPGAAGAFVEGRRAGGFGAARALAGPATPVALGTNYLGDVALLSTARTRTGWALALRVQRHYSAAPSRPRLLAVGRAAPRALAVALDYRSDVLVVWAAAGELYARALPANGGPSAAAPTQRLGPAPGAPEVRALISDDERAIVAWRTQTPAPAAQTTTIAVAVSARGPRFAPAPALVERYADPPGRPPPSGALRLARMSSEAVMLAWTGRSAGRYVVRASPVSLRRGVWAPVTISPRARAARDALLADLAAGPRAEVLALWTTSPRAPGAARAIVSAWGHYGPHGEARFAAPETLAAPGANGTPAVAIDPRSDVALAAWAVGTRAPQIVYARRAAGPPATAAPAATRAGDTRAGGTRTGRAGAGTPRALLLGAPAAALLLALGGAAWRVRPRARRRGALREQ